MKRDTPTELKQADSAEHFRRLENMYHSAPVNELYEPRLEVSEGRAVLRMEVRPRFFHAAEALHGSVYFKALDDAAFFATNSLVSDRLVLTSSFHIHLLRPVREGTLRAEGRVVSATRSLLVAEAELFADGDELVARGSGSFVRSRLRLADIETYR